MKVYTSIKATDHYRLLHLTPELERALFNNDLVIKAAGDDLVVCTANQTYKLRQTNQSNSLLLSKPHDPDAGVGLDADETLLQEATGAVSELSQSVHRSNETIGLLAFGNATSFVEPVRLQSVDINWSLVPQYPMQQPSTNLKSNSTGALRATKFGVEVLRKEVPASDAEFDRAWFAHGGFALDGQAYLPSDDIASKVLRGIMPYILSIDEWQTLPVDTLFSRLPAYIDEADSPSAVIKGVLHKFAKGIETGSETGIQTDTEKETEIETDTETSMEDYLSRASLDTHKIAKHFGLETLKKHCSDAKATRLPFFYDKWARSIPVTLDFELDMSHLLQGSYVCPSPSTIRYIEAHKLSTDPKARFQQLFRIKASWEISELLPFVEPVHLNKAVKLENFIKKYAKQRKMGQRVVITAS